MPPRNTPGNELVESRQTDDPRFGQAWSMPQHRPTFTFSISSCVSNHVSTKAGQAQYQLLLSVRPDRLTKTIVVQPVEAGIVRCPIRSIRVIRSLMTRDGAPRGRVYGHVIFTSPGG